MDGWSGNPGKNSWAGIPKWWVRSDQWFISLAYKWWKTMAVVTYHWSDHLLSIRHPLPRDILNCINGRSFWGFLSSRNSGVISAPTYKCFKEVQLVWKVTNTIGNHRKRFRAPPLLAHTHTDTHTHPVVRESHKYLGVLMIFWCKVLKVKADWGCPPSASKL